MFNFADVLLTGIYTWNKIFRSSSRRRAQRAKFNVVSGTHGTKIERVYRFLYKKSSRIRTSRILRARSPRERDKNFISRRHTLQCDTQPWKMAIDFIMKRDEVFRLRDSVRINVYTFCSFLFYSLDRKSSTLWSHRGTCTVRCWKEVSRSAVRGQEGLFARTAYPHPSHSSRPRV